MASPVICGAAQSDVRDVHDDIVDRIAGDLAQQQR
jgi:hypothetical protein